MDTYSNLFDDLDQQPAPRQIERPPNHSLLALLAFHAVMLIGAIIVCLPLFWMISASLKAPNEIFTIPIQWIPDEIQWENYRDAWNTAPFGRYFWNSFYTSTVTTLLNIGFCALAGYGFAKYKFFGKNLLFLFILGTMMIPFHVLIVPLFILMRDLNWLNTHLAIIVPGAISAFGIFFMRQFISSLPDEIFDAARIDGATEIGIFFRIVLPLSVPPMTALGVFIFLDNWNSLLWPLITITDDNLRTVAQGLTEFQTVYGTRYHQLAAASTLVAAPVIIVYFILQRYFIEGVSFSIFKR